MKINNICKECLIANYCLYYSLVPVTVADRFVRKKFSRTSFLETLFELVMVVVVNDEIFFFPSSLSGKLVTDVCWHQKSFSFSVLFQSSMSSLEKIQVIQYCQHVYLFICMVFVYLRGLQIVPWICEPLLIKVTN